METLKEFIASCDEAIALYADRWEVILRLPLQPLSATALFDETWQIIRECRRQTRDHAIGWLKEQVEDSRGLVRENLRSVQTMWNGEGSLQRYRAPPQGSRMIAMPRWG